MNSNGEGDDHVLRLREACGLQLRKKNQLVSAEVDFGTPQIHLVVLISVQLGRDCHLVPSWWFFSLRVFKGLTQMTVRENVRVDLGATLTQVGWLSRTPVDFQQAVLAQCIAQQRSAGDPLYYTGDEVGGIFGIVSGTVEIASIHSNEDAYFVHLAQAGTWIGEASVLTGVTRRISAAARTDCIVAYLPLAAITAIVTRHPEYWRYVGMLAVEHNNLATSGGADLMLRDVERRCLAVLLRVSGCRFRTPGSDDHPEAVISQEELAAMANLSRKSVGDILRKHEQLGHIELGYRTITVKAPNALRAIVMGG